MLLENARLMLSEGNASKAASALRELKRAGVLQNEIAALEQELKNAGAGMPAEIPVSLAAPSTFQFVTHRNLLPVAELAQPAKGQGILDPTFGLDVFRVSDVRVEAPGHRAMTPEYPCYSHGNCDGSLVLAFGHESGGRGYLYDAKTFKLLRDFGDLGDGGPRWDVRDPNVFYHAGQYSSGLNFTKVNALTGATAAVRDFSKDFPGAKWLFMSSEPSADTRYCGFLILRNEHDEHGTAGAATSVMAAIVYDLVEDKIVGKTTERLGRDLQISPSGRRVLMTDDKGFFGTWDQDRRRALARELFSYKLDFSEPVSLGTGHGHADLAFDVNGNEVIIYQDQHGSGLTMQDVNTGKKIKDFLPVGGGLHICGNAYSTPGWAVVSHYGGDGKNVRSWQEAAIYLLELASNPRTLRLAHSRINRSGSGYGTDPFAWIDTLGTRVYWGSNWGAARGTTDTYLIKLPAGWMK